MRPLGIKAWKLEETLDEKVISGECSGWPAFAGSGETSGAESYFFVIKKPKKNGAKVSIELSVRTCTQIIRALPWGTRLDLRSALAEEFAET